jgi:hypothetical protein
MDRADKGRACGKFGLLVVLETSIKATSFKYSSSQIEEHNQV